MRRGGTADKAALGAALAALPDDERRILSLTYEEGLSPGEVSEVLGLDEEEVRRRQTLAILRIRGNSKP